MMPSADAIRVHYSAGERAVVATALGMGAVGQDRGEAKLRLLVALYVYRRTIERRCPGRWEQMLAAQGVSTTL